MLGTLLPAEQYLARLQSEFNRLNLADLQLWADLIFEAWQNNRCVFIFGNGGSGLTASHICIDLGKGTLPLADLHDDSKKRLKVLALTDSLGWITAVSNDLAYDQIFVQQLMNWATAGDLAIGISSSGNSSNVLCAIDWANRHGLITFGLTGHNGGKLKRIQQRGLHVDLADCGMVESIHLCLFHWVLDDVHSRINQLGRYAPNRS
jgi:D-sedoheptulose 7-phosphate isomerase